MNPSPSNNGKSIFLLFFVMHVSACISVLSDVQKVEGRCNASNSLENEIIQCYKQANAENLTRKINMSIYGLTGGDWPFDYEFIYEMQLSKDGEVRDIILINESNSHRLNKIVARAVRKISNFYVPKNDLFIKGGFDALKIMIIPARTPILSEDRVVDQNTILIYLTELCSLRSDRC